MKTGEMAKRGLYIGAGAGLALFVILGFLPGSFIGGVIGLKIAGSIFGVPLQVTLLPRILVGMMMVLGTLTMGVVFVVGSSLLGWMAGYMMDGVRQGRATEAKSASVKDGISTVK